MQHKAKPSTVFATRPHPECCIISYNTRNGAFTDLLVLHGRIIGINHLIHTGT